MARAVFAYRNYADEGVIRTSSALFLTPPIRLSAQYPKIAVKCRNNGENAWSVFVDLLSPRAVDTFALFGTNLDSTATGRVRASLIDSSVEAAEVYDSGPITGGIDPKYGTFLHRSAALKTCRYARMDLSQPVAPYVEAGRAWVSPSEQVETNFSPGFARSRVDPSDLTESRSGTLDVDERPQYRVWDVTFDFLSDVEVDGFIEDMDWRNGTTRDVLLIRDPASSNLGRDSIFGLLKPQSIVQPYAMPNKFSRRYSIRERL